ncbi:MotA/TolQ/ExbB proton channel family protein [Rubritalea tangerina]|uniref:MotA/TolQ/ExbB proton channel family protein n=1 Tax=Rubritalea tangerina TaxID=430798 RepID=A0ABW4Z786_9BACT
MHHLLAEAQGLAKISEFYDKGGIIMYVLTFCSVLTVAVIVYKALDLGRKRVLPEDLKKDIDVAANHGDDSAYARVAQQSGEGRSVLARLSQVVVQRSEHSGPKIRDAVQAKAHEEIVKLQGGIGILDVVIVVAPMLGLLGTASGITTVFDGMSSMGDIKMSIMAAGVAEALTTTIAGLAVAVPAVIGHSIFNRKIETYASQLEVVVGNLVNAVSDDGGEEKA